MSDSCSATTLFEKLTSPNIFAIGEYILCIFYIY